MNTKKSFLRKFAPIVYAKIADRFEHLKSRSIHPEGHFDNGGRWYPNQYFDCCSIRSPSRNYPYSLMVHCRTFEHVCHEFEAEIDSEITASYDALVSKQKTKYTKIEQELLNEFIVC